MKQITGKTLKSFFATAIVTGAFVLGANAQQVVQSTGNIVSDIKVKETTVGNALLDLAIINKSTSPFLVVIRDESGSIVFREWAKGDTYLKRFKLSLFESDAFDFEVIQDKKLVDSKTFKVKRHTEEKLEVLAIN